MYNFTFPQFFKSFLLFSEFTFKHIQFFCNSLTILHFYSLNHVLRGNKGKNPVSHPGSLSLTILVKLEVVLHTFAENV